MNQETDINSIIDQWNDVKTRGSLSDALGMTKEKYAVWVKNFQSYMINSEECLKERPEEYEFHIYYLIEILDSHPNGDNIKAELSRYAYAKLVKLASEHPENEPVQHRANECAKYCHKTEHPDFFVRYLAYAAANTDPSNGSKVHRTSLKESKKYLLALLDEQNIKYLQV